MRMWMVEPRILCRKHFLGEHLELHMFIGTLKKGNNIDGYLQYNLCEPISIKSRHDELVKEMEKRKYNHNSDISDDDFNNAISNLYEGYRYIKIKKEKSLNELISRCPECKDRLTKLRSLNNGNESTVRGKRS